MNPIGKYFREPSPRRRLLLWAFLLLGLVRLALWTTPFRWVKAAVEKVGKFKPCDVEDRATESLVVDVAWAVRMASRAIPVSTCLPQALTGFVLWRRRGLPVEWRLGVAKESTSQPASQAASPAGRKGIRAHAWVELDGRVILGDLPDLHLFQALPPLDGRRRGDET